MGHLAASNCGGIGLVILLNRMNTVGAFPATWFFHLIPSSLQARASKWLRTG